MHLLFRMPLDDSTHTGNREEPTYQLKYITKWNERSEKRLFSQGRLVRMMWHYTQRGSPGEVEEIITDNIREVDWIRHRQIIFDWVEEERAVIDNNNSIFSYNDTYASPQKR